MNADQILYIIAAILLALDAFSVATPPLNKFSAAAFCLVLSLVL